LTPDRTELIQVQADQFFRNWRRVEGAETYPRFPTLLQRFEHEWDGYRKFAAEEKLGELKIDQCELTYVNQMDKGDGWGDFFDLPKIFTVLSPTRPDGLLVKPEIVSWSASYPLPEGRGRLRVDIAPGFRGRDLRMVASLSLTARGAPAGGNRDQLATWFESAHERIVRTFTELTTPAMHDVWKRRK